MKSSLSPFQFAVLGFFGLALVAAIAFIAITKANLGSSKPTIAIWGTLPNNAVQEVLSPIINIGTYKPVYEEHSADTFDSDLVEALANGKGPDLVILSQDGLFKSSARLLRVPYTAFTQRQFQDTFVQEGELLTDSRGILGFPIAIDPMVMFWNRDIYGAAGVAVPPKEWSQFQDLVPKLADVDQATLRINRAAVGLGETSNVDYAKEILLTLWMQAGGTDFNSYTADGSRPDIPLSLALNFYAGFSDSTKPNYSWNKSLPDTKSMFISGDLATYFGFASDAPDIRRKNGNLNFDVTPMPQARGAVQSITYGRMYAIGLVRNSPNSQAALGLASELFSATSVEKLAAGVGYAPTRRDLLASDNPTDAWGPIAYASALYSRAWPDPDFAKTQAILGQAVESAVSGQASVNDASKLAVDQIKQIAMPDATQGGAASGQ